MNTPRNDVNAKSDLLGQAEALERVAGGMRLKARGAQGSRGPRGDPQGDSGAVRLAYDEAVVVRAVDWHDAERVAWQIVNLHMVTVGSVAVLWSLGAGLYRVRVKGLHRYTLAAA